MSIIPAQMLLQVASAESSAAPKGSLPASPSSVPAATSAGDPPNGSSTSAPAVPSSPQLSTDMRIDDQHEVFYQFVDDRTGDVMFEIPPEALRAISESLNLPIDGGTGIHRVDVKS